MIPNGAIGTEQAEKGTGTGGRDTDVTNHIRHRNQNLLQLHPRLMNSPVLRPDLRLMGSGLMTGRGTCFLSVLEVRQNYSRYNGPNIERLFRVRENNETENGATTDIPDVKIKETA